MNVKSVSIQNASRAFLKALTDHFLKASSWPHNSSPRPSSQIHSAPNSSNVMSRNLPKEQNFGYDEFPKPKTEYLNQ